MILVVEDNDDLRDLFRFMLEYGGVGVVTAASGAEALARLRAAPRTRLVLLDLALPDMGGLDFVETVKAERGLGGIPIVLVSGMPLARVGGLPRLVKPVGPEDLLAAVRCYALPP
jgi:CheY-like chemotaxis protein